MQLPRTQNDIKYDIEETIEIILENKLSSLSSQLINQIKNVCWDFEELIHNEDNTKVDLKNILEYSEISKLQREYFHSLSHKTQEFILKYLPEDISWDIIITIDDSMRDNKTDNWKVEVEITWKNISNEETYNKFSYDSVNNILLICNELYTNHYLWLGLNDWKKNNEEEEYYINSLTVYKPNRQKKKIKDKKGEYKEVRTKTTEVINFPPQNNTEEE